MKRIVTSLVLVIQFQFAFSQWNNVPGGGEGQQVAAFKNTVWVIGSDNGIYLNAGTAWQPYPGNGKGYDISVYNDTPCIIGTDYKIYKGTGTGWAQVTGKGEGKRIAADSSGRIWIIGMDNAIYFLSDNKWQAYPGKGQGFDIAVYDNIPYIIGTDNKIYKGNGSGWTLLSGGGEGKRIAVDNAGKIWLIGRDNSIYFFDEINKKWREVPGQGKGFDVCAYNGTTFIIGQDYHIYRTQ
jgi:hypothetical protein